MSQGAVLSDTGSPFDDRSPRLERNGDAREAPYPGIPTTCDGAEAVVHVDVNVAQSAGAYPITSSTTMGGGFNAAVMNGHKNLWGDTLMFFEPESEHSAASVCEGFAVAGGRVFVTSAVSTDPKATFRPGLYGDGDASADRSTQRWTLFALDAEMRSHVFQAGSRGSLLAPFCLTVLIGEELGFPSRARRGRRRTCP